MVRRLALSWVVGVGLGGCGGEQPSEGPAPPGQEPLPIDLDNDGFDETEDCDDLYAAVYPGAPERCDGIDNDCDQQIDEDAEDAIVGYLDQDGDGFGDDSTALRGCALPEDYVLAGGDCDGSNAAIHPGAPELCDGLDNDCDPLTTEDGVVSADGVAYPNVQGAIDGAGDGATITLCDGEYYENLFVPSTYESLTLVSRSGPESTVLDGGANAEVLYSLARSLTLEGITFRNGYDDERFGYGGGVEVHGEDAAITDCMFVDNAHSEEGGALAVYQGDATITDSVFVGNQTGFSGGAIWAFWANVTITDSRFEDNRTPGIGGAIYAQEASFRLERVDFVGNVSGDGGAGYFYPGFASQWPTQIVDSSFVDNVATGTGGAVFDGGGLSCSGSTFEGNEARNGGALTLGADGVLDSVTITGNSASNIGGGLLLLGSNDILDSVIERNTANRGGGAGTAFPVSGALGSVNTDWGDGASDNVPEDLYLGQPELSDEAVGDFTCNLATGSCQ